MTRKQVAVAMSGGVDSSVAAAILKEQGFEVIGFSLQFFDKRQSPHAGDEPQAGRCCAPDDLHDARSIAAQLGILHYVINLKTEFETQVVHSFVRDYINGLTPSPCIRCNSVMKFGHLMKLAQGVDAAHIATGHYARIAHDQATDRFMLLKGSDLDKDQSYFLFELNQEQLAKAMFPVGFLDKAEVRRIAARLGLEVAHKAESQEICFVPDGDYARFVQRCLEAEGGCGECLGGEIVDRKGKVVGRHQGIHRYTIGQRRGLGIAHSAPLYVIDLQPTAHRVVVGERPFLARQAFHGERANWISIPAPTQLLRAAVKIRSRHAEAPAVITPIAPGKVFVEFDAPQMAITPGQAAVFYDGESVLGGAWISAAA
jgi:tRNA-specific 2-thiouridylase